MPSNAIRTRIDWQPGDAALEALEIAESLRPHLRTQELIDMLVITGLAALRHEPWAPPTFHGFNRNTWRLPASLRPLRVPSSSVKPNASMRISDGEPSNSGNYSPPDEETDRSEVGRRNRGSDSV